MPPPEPLPDSPLLPPCTPSTSSVLGFKVTMDEFQLFQVTRTWLMLFSPLLAWRVSEGFMQASIPQLLGQLFHGVYISSSMIEQNKGILKTRKGSLVLVFILLLLQKLEL
ncbi:hypothetical protein ACB094_12G139400 [Castanea mollissima]